jgi:predicted DNA-binding transcriptional regulator AlpA
MSVTVMSNVNEHEAATYLGVSVHSLRRWRWIGGGPKFRKLGSRVVYPLVELDTWQADKLRSSTSDQGTAGKTIYSADPK